MPVPKSADAAELLASGAVVVDGAPDVPVVVEEAEFCAVVFEEVVLDEADVEDGGIEEGGVEDDGVDDDGAEETGADDVVFAEAVWFEESVRASPALPVVLEFAIGVVEVDPVVDCAEVALVPAVLLRSAEAAPVIDPAGVRMPAMSWQLASSSMPVQVGAAAVPAVAVCELTVVDVEFWLVVVGVPLCVCAWGAPKAMNAETIPSVRVFMRIPRQLCVLRMTLRLCRRA